MDPKEKQKLYILFGIFGIALLIVYYNLLLKPQFSGFITMNREFLALKNRVRNAEILIANEDKIKEQYDNIIKQAELFEMKLPDEDEVSSLLEDFSSVAESSGVKILKIKPLEAFADISQAKGGTKHYSEFPILIEARAGYHQCGIFINKLENMDRLIKVNDIDIRSRPKDPRHHDIRLKVSTYVMQ